MAQPRKWLDEIIDVLEELGGKASLSDIYRKIEQRNIMNLHRTWTASVRRTIESYSSDCDAFYGKEDIFYSVEGKGKGIWGLRKYQTKDNSNSTSKLGTNNYSPSPFSNKTTIAIAPTDLNWFYYLREQSNTNIVNFWTPTPWNIKRLKEGDKFYFLLKSPIRKIGGFGYFKKYDNMSVYEAWIKFGKGNGVSDLTELAERCSNYVRKHTKKDLNIDDLEIGCIVLENPVFFDDEHFFSPEKFEFNFAPQIVKIKYFDSDFPAHIGETMNKNNNFNLILENNTEYQIQKSKKRKGQSEFRNKVLKAYDYRCAVTGETCIEVLQAAHIQPYINEQSNHIQNGICLRIDIHKLFDEGLITINDDYRIIVSPLLNTSPYKTLNGVKINLPKNPHSYPSLEALKQHRKTLFRGNIND